MTRDELGLTELQRQVFELCLPANWQNAAQLAKECASLNAAECRQTIAAMKD